MEPFELQYRIVLPKQIEVVVASFGGVGTTFLLSFLNQYRQTNHPDDLDGFKHSSLPPLSLNSNVRFVYVYGDPQLAAISLFRRKYQYPQSTKLQKWIRNRPSPISGEITLKDYVASGIDKFYFREHFYNWYEKYLVHPTLFIRYEKLFENVQALTDFLDLPSESRHAFPQKKSRSSKRDEVSSSTLKQLEAMYGSFSEELRQLEDVEVRARPNLTAVTLAGNPEKKVDTNQSAWNSKTLLKRYVPDTAAIMQYMKKPYSKALVRQAAWDSKAFLREYLPEAFSALKKLKQGMR